jgi:hypothetical protein
MGRKFLHQNPIDPRRYDVIEHPGYESNAGPAGWGWTWLSPLIISTVLLWMFRSDLLWTSRHTQWSAIWVAIGVASQMREFWRNLLCFGLVASPVILCLWSLGIFHMAIYAVTGIDLTRR